MCLLCSNIMRQHLLILAVCADTIVHLLHAGPHDIVAHVEAELTHLALLDKLAVLALTLARSCADALPASLLVGGEIVVDLGLGLGLLGHVVVRVVDLGGEWHARGRTKTGGSSVALSFATLALCCFFSFQALAGGFVFAWSFASVLSIHMMM